MSKAVSPLLGYCKIYMNFILTLAGMSFVPFQVAPYEGPALSKAYLYKFILFAL